MVQSESAKGPVFEAREGVGIDVRLREEQV